MPRLINIEPILEDYDAGLIFNHELPEVLRDAPTIEPVSQWISASEPPESYRDEYGELIPFLVCEEGTEYSYRAVYDGKNWGDGILVVPVKWWMPLPMPPKE